MFRIRKQVIRFSCFCVAMVLLVFLSGTPLGAQNSTRKNRIKPSALSAKVGTGVKWAKSLEAAQKMSASTGKPVFWYLSTVPGTFMDRKAEIDRYMLGGPFSWPPIIQLLNEHFVPVRAKPAQGALKYGIRTYQFIEPGFLILDQAGKPIQVVDRLTTYHYGWLSNVLIESLKKVGKKVKPPEQPAYFDEFAKAESEWGDPLTQQGTARNSSNLLLSGMIAFRKGDHERAKRLWVEASTAEPENPLAWKASLEAQGLGPFFRGFEVFRLLPEGALRAGIDSKGSAAPEGVFDRSEIIRRSVRFLLGMQRMDGAFVDSDYDFGGTDSLPNVHVAVTSLAGMALLRVHDSIPDLDPELKRSILRAAEYAGKRENLNFADRDEILWAQSYRLRFLSRCQNSGLGNFSKSIQAAVRDLENIQLKTGNWYHEYNNPFVTATALCALYEAESAKGKVDQEKINRGVASLQRDRFQNGTYPYYSVRRKRDASKAEQQHLLQASAGRMPLCELALVQRKQIDQKRLIAATENSLQYHRHLMSAYKYDNHTSNMSYGGFFFWYDMRGRSEAIRSISDEAIRSRLISQQDRLVLGLPELDGCFIDSHELGRCYGTAMAILSLKTVKE